MIAPQVIGWGDSFLLFLMIGLVITFLWAWNYEFPGDK